MFSHKMLISTVLLFLCGIASNVVADRCDPKMLAKLPESKRAMIEKRCAKKAARPAYTISNRGKEAQEPMPENAYQGNDLDSLIKKVEKAWKRKYRKDKVLAVKITSEQWKRDVNVRANTTSIYANDKSVLVAKVIVKDNNKYATIFPAYINKDNSNGRINIGVATKKSQYVIKQMLLTNVE